MMLSTLGLFISFWGLPLCVTARHAKSSGLRGRGYPLDSPNATWLPVEDEVDESLADTKDGIEETKTKLAYVKEYCNGKNHGRCKDQVERMSARLSRLIAAEKQLRAKDASAPKVEDGVRTVSETVYELENQVDGLHAVKKFAELSKADFDNQYKRLSQASDEYQKKMDQAQSQIDSLEEDLKRSRRLHYDAEQRSLNLIAKAKGIERGVDTTDLYADAEFAKAVRKQHVAEMLYARADAIREHAEKMMILHHDENKSEVKEVMYGTAHRLITEDQGIVNFGHMSDFGGELPHEKGKPCRKVTKVKKDKKAPWIRKEDDDDDQSENPNAPAFEPVEPEETTTTTTPEPVETTTTFTTTTRFTTTTMMTTTTDEPEPAAQVVVDSPNDNGGNGDGWEEVEIKDANDHADQWVALHHHQSSKKTVTNANAAKHRMINHGHQKKVSEPKARVVAPEKPIEIKKAPEAQKPYADDDDEPQPVEDDESGGDDEAIDEVVMPSVEEPAAPVVTTTVAAASAPSSQADPLDALASEDNNAEVDEDSAELAEAEDDDDASNMDEAERQFRDAEEAEKALDPS
jgi:uncharacterized protein YukE